MLTFYPDYESQWRLAATLIALFTIPGLVLVTWLPKEWQWDALSKWSLATGLSIATYPALLYGTRLLASSFSFTSEFVISGLAFGFVIIVWRFRQSWRTLFNFSFMEVMTMTVFGFTLGTRFWLIQDQPYPASPDSFHHTLITQLVARTGQLPETLDPYYQIPLAMYHLGLYAISGLAQLISDAPAHTAVLWVAQVLNGLCGVGLYLLLKHRVNHFAGLVGALVVGLFSFQPAWLSSWGRFTVVASGTLLPFAWLLTLMAIDQWKKVANFRQISFWLIGVSALATASTFLLHYRVAGYYLPLLVITLSWEALKAYKVKRLTIFWSGVGILGLITLAMISPAVWSALQAFIHFNEQNNQFTAVNAEQRALYFDYPLTWVTDLGARPWLWMLTAISGLWGIWRRSGIIIISLLWLLVLFLEGNIYLLNIPFLAFTNMSAVLISLYLPIGTIIGAALGELWTSSYRATNHYVNLGVVGTLVIAAIVTGQARSRERIEQYYFVTQADVEAMNWIRENTPLDARFAVNTHFFSSNFAHGTDAGYWIPYFTQRSTTSATMLLPLGATVYEKNFLDQSRAVRDLETDIGALSRLYNWGVNYVYIGKRGNQISSDGVGFSIEKMKQLSDLRIVYEKDGVSIFEIEPPILPR